MNANKIGVFVRPHYSEWVVVEVEAQYLEVER